LTEQDRLKLLSRILDCCGVAVSNTMQSNAMTERELERVSELQNDVSKFIFKMMFQNSF
jgi:predicted transcriptional regulator